MEAEAVPYSDQLKGVSNYWSNPGYLISKAEQERARFFPTSWISLDELPYRDEIGVRPMKEGMVIADYNDDHFRPIEAKVKRALDYYPYEPEARDYLSGGHSLIRYAEMENGEIVIMKTSSSMGAYEASAFALLSDLGIGPKFRGVYQGQYVVMDLIPGYFDGRNYPLSSFIDLETMIERLLMVGFTDFKSSHFQIMETTAGRLLLIDPSQVAWDIRQSGYLSAVNTGVYNPYRLGRLIKADPRTVGIPYLEFLRQDQSAHQGAWVYLTEAIQSYDSSGIYKDYLKKHELEFKKEKLNPTPFRKLEEIPYFRPQKEAPSVEKAKPELLPPSERLAKLLDSAFEEIKRTKRAEYHKYLGQEESEVLIHSVDELIVARTQKLGEERTLRFAMPRAQLARLYEASKRYPVEIIEEASPFFDRTPEAFFSMTIRPHQARGCLGAILGIPGWLSKWVQ
jgi:hypothetical protein